MNSPRELTFRSLTPFEIPVLMLFVGVFIAWISLKSWIFPVALLVGAAALGVALRSTFAIWLSLLLSMLFINNYLNSPLSSLIFWGLIGIFIFSVWWHQYIAEKPLVVGNLFFWTSILGWYAWGILAAVFSPDKLLSIKEMFRYGIGLGVLFTFIQWCRDEVLLLKVLRIVWVCLIIYSVLMIGKILFAEHPLGLLLGGKWHTPAESASYCAAFLPIFVSLLRRMRGNDWINWLGVLILFIAIVLSNSAAALLAAGVGVLVILGLKLPKIFRRIMILSSLVITGVLILGSMYIKNFNEAFIDQLSGRERIWPAAIRAIVSHPLLGVGPGRWSQWFSSEYSSADFIFDDKQGNIFYLDPSNLSGQAHNLFLTKAAEMGIPSFLLLLCVFGAWFLNALFVFRSLPNNWQRDLLRGCLASTIGLTFFCLFENGPIIGVSREGEILFVMMILAIPLMMGAPLQRPWGAIDEGR